MMPGMLMSWGRFRRSRLFWRLVDRLWDRLRMGHMYRSLHWMADGRMRWPLYGMTDRCISWSLHRMGDRRIPRPLHRMSGRRVRVWSGRPRDAWNAADLRRSLHKRSAWSIDLSTAQQRLSSQGRAIERRPGWYPFSPLIFVFTNRSWWRRCRLLHTGRPGRRATLSGIIEVGRPGCRYGATFWCPGLWLRCIDAGSCRIRLDSSPPVSAHSTEAGVFREISSARATFLHRT
jgi:hypothetical protein